METEGFTSAIKFFRKLVAEKEGISEEDAGKRINSSVETSLELLKPLYNLNETIRKKAKVSEKEAMTMMASSIAMLLSSLTKDGKEIILERVKDTIKMEDEYINDEELKERFDNFIKKERGGN